MGVCALAVGAVVACDRQSAKSPLSPSTSVATGAPAAADGSTLKIGAPTIVAPKDNFTFARNTAIVLTFNNVSGTYASFPVVYEVELRNAAGAVVNDGNVNAGNGPTTSFTVTTKLTDDAPYTWRVRATYNNAVGPWSPTAGFRTPLAAIIADPLTNGTTIGARHGGHFVPGQGWQADTLSDGIDYDLPTSCTNCRLEFDVTGVGKGLGNPADLKFVSMGDATAFGDFGTFRNHPWKMHLEQRGDGDGTGVHLVWRNGSTDPDGDPGDHDTKINFTDLPWDGNNVIHFVLDWTPDHFFVSIAGEVMFDDGFAAPYDPPNFRISLGCYPRGETYTGAIWRNVVLIKR